VVKVLIYQIYCAVRSGADGCYSWRHALLLRKSLKGHCGMMKVVDTVCVITMTLALMNALQVWDDNQETSRMHISCTDWQQFIACLCWWLPWNLSPFKVRCYIFKAVFVLFAYLQDSAIVQWLWKWIIGRPNMVLHTSDGLVLLELWLPIAVVEA